MTKAGIFTVIGTKPVPGLVQRAMRQRIGSILFVVRLNKEPIQIEVYLLSLAFLPAIVAKPVLALAPWAMRQQIGLILFAAALPKEQMQVEVKLLVLITML